MELLAFTAPGMPELIIIFVVVLIIFGPKSLPKLARSLGSTVREFREATTKMTESVMAEDKPDQRAEPAQRIAPVPNQEVHEVVEAEKVSQAN